MLLQYHGGLMTCLPQSFMLLISRFCGATKTYIINDAGRQICRVSNQIPTLAILPVLTGLLSQQDL